MGEIVLNRSELNSIMKDTGNGFVFRKGKYTRVLRPKLEAILKVPLNVAEPMKTSGGKGEKATKRMYWICPHGRNSKESILKKKKPRFKRVCKISVSCLASSFHPNQDKLNLSVSPLMCPDCLKENSPSSGSLNPQVKNEKTAGKKEKDYRVVEAAFSSAMGRWKSEMEEENRPLEHISRLINIFKSEIKKENRNSKIVVDHKALEHMNKPERDNYTILTVPKKKVRITEIVDSIPFTLVSDDEEEDKENDDANISNSSKS